MTHVALLWRTQSVTCGIGVAAVLLLSVVESRPAFATCGDQIIDIGEECDDGNTDNDDCCSATCQLEAAGSPCADDGNPCTYDQCDGNGTCLHLHNEEPCSDSDPCTVGVVCGTGVCGVFTPEACVDHYMCYKVKSTQSAALPLIVLTDPFETVTPKMGGPKVLCLPASKDGAAIVDPVIHEEGYHMRVKKSGQREVTVTDQFGRLRLDLLRQNRLLVPTTKGLGNPPPAPPPSGAANHYRCWKAKRNEHSSPFPSGVQASVVEQFENRLYDIKRPGHLCTPVHKNGEPILHSNVNLMCYRARPARKQPKHTPLKGVIHTENQFGSGRLNTRKEAELCVPAQLAGCPLPRCKFFPTQRPDCSYDPVVANPTYPFCTGPKVFVDRTHDNFHQVTPESRDNPGRYWGFAKLLARHGYDVRESTTSFATLLPATDAKIIVTANARASGGPSGEAFPADDVSAIADWVSAGGSLLLIIDHRPYERAGALLAAFGLDRLFNGSAPRHRFTRAAGTLNGSSFFANGRTAAERINEVTTFTGTAFSISATPPPQASFEPALTFPPGVMGRSDSTSIDLGGYLQGVAIRFGLGRVFVSGEAGALTAQSSFGMQFTPDNEQYVLNIIHWLDQ
jgi:cysteine-rich repeat protein